MSELQDLSALIRANTPLIVIETQDEGRIVELFRQTLMHVWRALHRWSITEGLRRIDLDREDPPVGPPDASAALQMIRQADQRGVYLLLDFHPYLGYASHQRALRDLIQRRHSEPHVLVLIGAKVELPAELEALAVRFNPRLPDANALLKMLREEADAYAREHGGRRVEVDSEAVKKILKNLQGLSLVDARRIARQLIYADGALRDDDLPQLARLKFELLNRSGHLFFEHDSARFGDVAGANRLKRWISQRRVAFIAGSAPAGLDPPRGMLLLGVQGCGKSMLAKATAAGFGVPLLRLDVGALYNKYHGETEANLRQALASAEQLAPCVLWMDEIEKGLASGGEDGGVSRRVLGYLLTGWPNARRRSSSSPPPTRCTNCRPSCCARAVSTRSSSSTCPPPKCAWNCCGCIWGDASSMGTTLHCRRWRPRRMVSPARRSSRRSWPDCTQRMPKAGRWTPSC